MDYYLGIDLGGTRIKIGLSKNNQIVDIHNIKACRKKNFHRNIEIIEKAINSICEHNKIQPTEIKGIGFAFPGLVDSKNKKIISTNAKYDDAIDFDWDKWASKFNAYIVLENDARMACFGEWKNGAGKGHTDLVVITLGTGIGTAVVIDNKLLIGKHFQAGNLGGHFSINYDGRICTCGNRGCVEAEASSVVLNTLIKQHQKIEQSILKDKTEIGFSTLFKYARADKVALEIRNHCLDVWSSAIISYIHAYDPEVVILVGGIMNSKKVILPYIENKVNKLAWTPWGKVKIVSAELNDNAGVNGAILMAKQLHKEHEEVSQK